MCHKGEVRTGPDLDNTSRETLLAVIAEQQTVISDLERRLTRANEKDVVAKSTGACFDDILHVQRTVGIVADELLKFVEHK